MLGKQQRGEQAGSKRWEVDEDTRLTCSGKEWKGQGGQIVPCTSEQVSVVSKLAHCPGLGPGCVWERAYRRAAVRVKGMTLGS